MSVYKAINAVQAALSKEGISKDRKNVQQGYAFRGIDDVYNALAPLLASYGLCILPRVTSRECVERLSGKGAALFYVTVGMEFDFVSSEDGSKHTVSTYGEAMDSGDKATNKAMSAAYKYACMQAFAIPTEGDNDADSQTHVVKPNVISPVKEALKGTSVDMEVARKIASSLVDLYADDASSDADYQAWELIEPMDSDLKLAVWDILQPHSKVRSWLKKVGDEHRAKA